MQSIFTLIVIYMATAGVSSMWLYSPGFHELKEAWIKHFASSSVEFINKLQYLGICQLCCSFWFALPIIYFLLDVNIVLTICIAIGAAYFSWFTGSIVQKEQWEKALLEKKYNDNL